MLPVKRSVAVSGLLMLLSAVPVQASPMTDYNLILLGDLKSSSLHVYDRSFIGGNINTSGWVEFGSRMDKNSSASSVEVAGSLYAPGATIQAGYLSYGGTNQLGNINCNGNNLSNGRCINQGQQLNDKAAALAQQLYKDSSYLASLQTNGNVNLQQNQKSFSYQANDSVAVFTIDGADLFSQNSNWSLFAGFAETVIINVSGTHITNLGGVNLNQGFSAWQSNNNIGASNILWNFYEALEIDLGSMRLNGSLLAPYADIRSWNDIDGSVAARSYSGAGQIHNQLFNWRLPQSDLPSDTVEVPSPAPLLLMLAGFAAIPLFRKRSRRI